MKIDKEIDIVLNLYLETHDCYLTEVEKINILVDINERIARKLPCLIYEEIKAIFYEE